jgi:hypothetical protein
MFRSAINGGRSTGRPVALALRILKPHRPESALGEAATPDPDSVWARKAAELNVRCWLVSSR